MLSMISVQYHRLQPLLKTVDDDLLTELNKYFRASVSLLTVVSGMSLLLCTFNLILSKLINSHISLIF